MRSKVANFYNTITQCEFDLVAISESWLTNDILNSELSTDIFTIYRKDRALESLGVTRGGGVLLAVRSSITATELDLSSINDVVPYIDIVGVKITSHNNRKLLVFVLYIPPHTSSQNYELFFDAFTSLEILMENHQTLIKGDFNAPGFSSNSNDKFCSILNFFKKLHSLQQHNHIENANVRCLDLIFSNF